MATFIRALPQRGLTAGKCVGSCHEWYGPRMGENRGYRCEVCGAEVESAADMRRAPPCAAQIVPVTWLPERVLAALTEDS